MWGSWRRLGRATTTAGVAAAGGGRRGATRQACSSLLRAAAPVDGALCSSPGLGEVMEALQMNQKHFKERYSHDMPSRADYLVFSCLAGVRSNQALDAAKSLGFNRAGHYAGGFKEWTEYESLGNK